MTYLRQVLIAAAILVTPFTVMASAEGKPGQASPDAGPVVVIETAKGTIEFETYPKDAPKTVAHVCLLN